MLNVIIVAVIVATAIWVYLDATKNRIGKIPDSKGIFNMSAGAWSAVTLLMWIIGFPAYLIKRRGLLAAAAERPVEADGRVVKAIILAIVGGLWVLVSFNAAVASALPSCESSGATQLVGKVITDNPIVKAAGIQYVTVKGVTEQGYNNESEIRSCSGTLVTSAGEDSVQYSIKWNDKKKGRYSVEARIAN